MVIVQIIDVDGTILGNYRKSHIPDGNGYQEKFYFSPGDTGFKVFDTFYGRIGVAICWDQVIFIQYITYVLHVHFNLQCQWFPEAARAMALQGAEILCKCFIDKHIDILLYNLSLFIVHCSRINSLPNCHRVRTIRSLVGFVWSLGARYGGSFSLEFGPSCCL